VLKPEHLHYTEEVRLLSTRSTAMIQRLMDHRLPGLNTPAAAPGSGRPLKMADAACSGSTENKVAPVSLRSIVERSSGLLRRVACGRTIEICYGAAAAVPVRVADESVERILVNLVRNAAAALTERDPAGSPAVGLGETGLGEAGSDLSCVSEFDEESCVGANQPPGAIRIGVGCLMNRVGDAKPWPFRRVRLTVEDAGCGIAPEQLERLVSGGRAPSRGSHGIGFRVVRELVAGSGGDLRVMSTPAIGTRVQIEWPMAAAASEDPMDRAHGLAADAERRKSC